MSSPPRRDSQTPALTARALRSFAGSLLGLILACAMVAVLPSSAAAQVSCAGTTTPADPNLGTAGDPCWTQVTPYPFGFDGNPVQINGDPANPASYSAACQAQMTTHPSNGGPNFAACYLAVDSMAFRAWNRGLAVVSPLTGAVSATTTPYGVWLYNGTRWFSDPTFPGQKTCPGNTILWAGKLDYWLVGYVPENVLSGAGPTWPSLCRFDGANHLWEPLPFPKAALAHVPLLADVTTTGTVLTRAPGAITTGACFAWNNCWFFGTYGIVLHWDGGSLVDATPNPSAPWLRSGYTAAVTTTDGAGNPFAVAVTDSTTGTTFNVDGAATGSGIPPITPTPPAPDGAPPQMFESTGNAFTPLAFGAPATSSPTPVNAETDLVAVDFNSAGQGWVAGDPDSVRVGLSPHGAAGSLAPLLPVSPDGTERCPGESFPAPQESGPPWWLWSSIATLPDGDAIAGGEYEQTASIGTEPVVAQVTCGGASQMTVFPPAQGSWMTSLEVDASNDGWAATTSGGGSTTPPTLYRYTDGQPPDAPPGDDNESRALPLPQQQSPFVVEPPVQISTPPPTTSTTQQGKNQHKHHKLSAPIDHVSRARTRRMANGDYRLVIAFHVVRKVTIGLEALHGHTVVSSSGLRTFQGGHGSLTLILNPKRWPTKIKFVQPPAKKT